MSGSWNCILVYEDVIYPKEGQGYATRDDAAPPTHKLIYDYYTRADFLFPRRTVGPEELAPPLSISHLESRLSPGGRTRTCILRWGRSRKSFYYRKFFFLFSSHFVRLQLICFIFLLTHTLGGTHWLVSLAFVYCAILWAGCHNLLLISEHRRRLVCCRRRFRRRAHQWCRRACDPVILKLFMHFAERAMVVAMEPAPRICSLALDLRHLHEKLTFITGRAAKL